MQDIKTIISITAIILTFIGYIPYLRDTLQGKTTPHVYTWFIWGFVTAIAFGLQVEGGAGVGSWVTIVVAIICFTIFLLGMRSGKKDIALSDTIFFVLSFVALFLWLIAKQPVLSVILTSTIDLLGFAPTVRKSWNKPHSETLFTYELSTLRHGLSILALQQYSIVTWLYPVSWTFANALFSLILIIRRKQVNK
ncbi:hypothetical protein A3B42_01445 [Candidatus Daviesbacteria bacterium RIFCSPLOWO2_01_FULL_38_10]|nr:MAG: hypothetical protein US80_C0001G0051 [Candidatus Daviesbacteria bacterium GW2011_GWA2_38_17]OGE27275.1 MAG: hypothetical protein A3D02_03155 [Candidatus Daviesbacteria bacterium RIFCSPHIGHO2_02_FULL_39_41]OGE27648.1 MAG: hypothetical protein A2772_02865 [Candidatus Daviesbacteria bacterium RIFCSPHIGHO2_01_FULL_38_8b]OGE37190.1 MAG: hypothetical protein A3B42_01445 [Candidatus Daviesbacteria bacterium RIFCSPLOWO2_01_FULL_38_10]OGE45001.1 MAG: hypothetical protein A3E67_02465 [Candidatus 